MGRRAGGECQLGAVRLAIIDIPAGAAPVVSARVTLWQIAALWISSTAPRAGRPAARPRVAAACDIGPALELPAPARPAGGPVARGEARVKQLRLLKGEFQFALSSASSASSETAVSSSSGKPP